MFVMDFVLKGFLAICILLNFDIIHGNFENNIDPQVMAFKDFQSFCNLCYNFSQIWDCSDCKFSDYHSNRVCTFERLKCNSNGYLIFLAMGNIQITGTIPKSFGDFKSLEYLDLSRNNFTNSIPEELGTLTNLSYLLISSNHLSGLIPTSIYSLHKLKVMNFSHNQLSGNISPMISNLISLKILNLKSNYFTSILPSTIIELTEPIYFDFSFNRFTSTIPFSLGGISNLQYLDLCCNGFHGNIPSTIGNCSQLTFLSLSQNQIQSSIPASIGDLVNLHTLSLFSNFLTGSIPSTINHLTALQSLELQSNVLTSSFPTGIGLLTNLRHLDLSSNSLSSTIPMQIQHLEKLLHLGLGRNSMTGTLPAALGSSLVSLTHLSLNNNRFVGSIPPSYGHFSSIQLLHLQHNSLTSTLPVEFGILTNLIELKLQYNHLQGVLPVSLANLTRLTVIDLTSNWFSGPSVKTLCSMTSLLQLIIDKNLFSKTIPTCLSMLTHCTYLALGGNRFTSSTSADIFATIDPLRQQLLFLDISNLNFGGTIPTSICNLKFLQQLKLSSNSFTSSVPSCLTQLDHLTAMDLRNNLLTAIPVHLSALTVLRELRLDNNRIVGTIPPEVCSIRTLTRFTLTGNNMTCHSSCQTDVPWGSTGNAKQDISAIEVEVAFPRCQDLQDTAMTDLQHSLNVVSFLQRNSISTTTVLKRVQTFPFHSNVTLFQDTNAFQLSVSMSPSTNLCRSKLYLCSDIRCRVTYGVFEGLTWSYPINLEGQYLTIQSDSFYMILEGRADDDCFYDSSYDFEITVISRSIAPVSWTFETNPPYPSPSPTPSTAPSLPRAPAPLVSAAPSRGSPLYARGLCQNEWTAVTCVNGFVTAIDLNGFKLKGSIPSSLAYLSRLTQLDLSNNLIYGTVPTALGTLQDMDMLFLTRNSLTGSVPTSIFKLKNLFDLDVSYNQFAGSLPESVDISPSIRGIDLSGNLFSGEVTTKLCAKVISEYKVIILENSPSVTCYQEFCPPTRASGTGIITDSSLQFCTPTTQPSLNPNRIPTFRPSTTEELIYQQLSTTSGIASLTVCSFLFWLCCAIFIYYRMFSNKAVERRKKRFILKSLPIHRYIHNMRKSNNKGLLDIIHWHINTVNLKDMDGNTVLDMIIRKKEKLKVDSEIIFTLLLQCLPFDVDTLEPIIDITRTYGWTAAVQQDDDVILEAVERVVNMYKLQIDLLANVTDASGRRCKDIAGVRCREAIYRKLYLFERYELKDGPPEHRSATSLVIFARDHAHPAPLSHSDHSAPTPFRDSFVDHIIGDEDGDIKVALKFMRFQDQFIREVEIRIKAHFDDKYVLPILNTFDESRDTPADTAFRDDAIRKGYSDYPYCIVMVAASKSLKRIIDHEHIVGADWDVIRQMTRTLAMSLGHIHSKHIIHGDLKPLNILLVETVLKLTDFDASTTFGLGELVSDKYSSGYIPPERLGLSYEGDIVILSKPNAAGMVLETATNGDIFNTSEIPLADPSQDMWALGCILYLLCTGCTLLHTSTEDNIVSQEDLFELYNWENDLKESKLESITNRYAKNLISLLLSKDPNKRPTAARVLQHPFITNAPVSRLLGERPCWDVFLSYRVDSDLSHAEALYNALQDQGLTVWWDKKCLPPGENWEEGFCRGLINAANFVCLLSRNAIKNPIKDMLHFEKLSPTAHCDNVVLEWRLALELQHRGMISGIFPVMIGDRDPNTGHYSHYFRSGCNPSPPDIVIPSIELKLKYHLDREGLGSPYFPQESLKNILRSVLSNQGGFIEGDFSVAKENISRSIRKMCPLPMPSLDRNRSQPRSRSATVTVTALIKDTVDKKQMEQIQLQANLIHNLNSKLQELRDELCVVKDSNEHYQRELELLKTDYTLRTDVLHQHRVKQEEEIQHLRRENYQLHEKIRTLSVYESSFISLDSQSFGGIDTIYKQNDDNEEISSQQIGSSFHHRFDDEGDENHGVLGASAAVNWESCNVVDLGLSHGQELSTDVLAVDMSQAVDITNADGLRNSSSAVVDKQLLKPVDVNLLVKVSDPVPVTSLERLKSDDIEKGNLGRTK